MVRLNCTQPPEPFCGGSVVLETAQQEEQGVGVHTGVRS